MAIKVVDDISKLNLPPSPSQDYSDLKDNIRIHVDGLISWCGESISTKTYTVLAFHRCLEDMLDDAMISGDDLLDITSSYISTRLTDNLLRINPPYHITDAVAAHLTHGSIIQESGNVQYDQIIKLDSYDDLDILYLESQQNIETDDWMNHD